MIEAMKQWLEALEKSQSALAEELSAWDIDPPLHHVQESHDLCGPAITSLRQAIREHAMYEVQRLGQEIEQEPVAFAGVEMWIGNTRIKKLMTQAELHYAIDPWAIVKFNSDGCIDALKEKNND